MIVSALAVTFNWNLWLAMAVAMAFALLVGFFNGYLVLRTGLPSFIVTLATLYIVRGATIGATRLLTGLDVIFITHNVHHAYPIGDRFTLLNRGRSYGTFKKSDVSREEVVQMMAGGQELEELTAELAEFARTDQVT